MGTFEITNSELNSQYTYKDNNVVVNGSFKNNVQTETLTSISGSAYAKNEQGEQGDYIGNFNGIVRNGEIFYSLSEMSRSQSNMVWDSIDAIEQNVLNHNKED